MKIPDINTRIRQLVDYYASGKVIKFSEMINVKQQTINRLFNIDTRTGKYPTVTTEILIAITELLVDVDTKWLLIGRGDMLKTEIEERSVITEIIYKPDPKDAELISSKNEIIETQKELISTLKQRIKELECNSSLTADAFSSAHSAASIGGAHRSKTTK